MALVPGIPRDFIVHKNLSPSNAYKVESQSEKGKDFSGAAI